MKVLIINHQHVLCGQYQFAKRVYTIASRSKKVEYLYAIITNRSEYFSILARIQPSHVIYNWDTSRLSWLLSRDIIGIRSMKHYFIYHDSIFPSYDKYLFFGDYDLNTYPLNKRVLLPRPLLDYNGVYPENKIPTIGSFGFGFNHKNFHLIVRLINDTFSEAVINLHMTSAYFGDTGENKLSDIINLCKQHNTNPNIKLNITTEFLDDDSLLTFLAKNDINIFYYKFDFVNLGLSSATDYALSVKRPIAITDNKMFRHFSKDDILIEKHSLSEILEKGVKPLEEYYDRWSTDRFSEELDNLIIYDNKTTL